MRYYFLGSLLIAGTLSAATATAQTLDNSIVQKLITFTGTVTNDVTSTVSLTGGLAPLQAPIPSYLLQPGDAFSITVDVTTVSDSYLVNTGQQTIDGSYVLPIQVQFSGNSPLARLNDVTFGGAFTLVHQSETPPFSTTGLNLMHDVQSGSYALDMPNGQLSVRPVSGPGWLYDFDEGALTSVDNNCFGGNYSGCASLLLGGFQLSGDLNILSAQVPIYSAPTATRESSRVGNFQIDISGSWDLPGFSSSGSSGGGATDVPAPAALWLFGFAGLSLLAMRCKHVGTTEGAET